MREPGDADRPENIRELTSVLLRDNSLTGLKQSRKDVPATVTGEFPTSGESRQMRETGDNTRYVVPQVSDTIVIHSVDEEVNRTIEDPLKLPPRAFDSVDRVVEAA